MVQLSRVLALVVPFGLAAVVVACSATSGRGSTNSDGGVTPGSMDGATRADAGGTVRRDGGATCSGGAPLLCGTSCVNPLNDKDNCGSCGMACTGSETCSNGECAAGQACPAAAPTRCGETCHDTLTDNSNCGGCGRACGTGTTCTNGACKAAACPTNLPTRCAGTCTNTQNDVANCGSCGNACTTGQTCSLGDCTGGGALTCEQCSDARCLSQYNACVGSAECVALVNCVQPCTTQACADACGASHPSGVTPYSNYGNCMQTNCDAECGGP